MGITRREMISAASAMGVVGALATQQAQGMDEQTSISNTVELANRCDLSDNGNDWHSLPPTDLAHALRAVNICRHSGAKKFRDLTPHGLMRWMSATNNNRVRLARGMYENGFVGVADKMKSCYAISYVPNDNKSFKLAAIGGLWGTCHKKNYIKDFLQAIRTDLIKLGLLTEESEYLMFRDIHGDLIRQGSLLGKSLKLIERDEVDLYLIRDQNNGLKKVKITWN